jgi:hypothetical protein
MPETRKVARFGNCLPVVYSSALRQTGGDVDLAQLRLGLAARR